MLLQACVCLSTLISYFVDDQSVKRLDQVRQLCQIVNNEFTTKIVTDNEIFYTLKNYDIFQIIVENELVASVYLHRKKYYVSTCVFHPITEYKISEQDAVEIYSLYVNKMYRQKGYARKLIWYALRQEKEHYKLPNDFVVSLHLNPDDKFMNISFAFYYSMNFRKGCFVQHGPSSLAPCFQKYKFLRDPLTIINKPAEGNGEGNYMALYTKYCDLLPFNPIRDKNLYIYGEKLRRLLKFRAL